ncbi:hypothetical protein WMY93_022692 [Mugilogobius chulae]|uniref:Small-subunit processome Utp12 domain-containing protein n=1 Tax=Mugilogobius chulae TaxID=88201 RepID=A0AAW0NCJ5_9GOBI
MKFAYRFSNLLGAVYRQGNLNFSKNGNAIISPVGNRISIFDLKNNTSETLPFSTTKNITCVGISPNGNLAIVVDEDGAALLVSLITRAILHHFHFHKPVHSISFSPDGRKFVVTKDNVALMYYAPGKQREFNAFVLDKSYYGPYDETTCIDWTTDSKCFAVGSKDMSTWVFGAERWANLIYYSLGGHKDLIVGCFFEKDSLDLYTVSQDGTLCVWESDTEPGGLVLSKKQPRAEEQEEEEDEEERMEGQQGEVIRGKAHTQKDRSRRRTFATNRPATAFHKPTHILVTGFASGIFHLHELPEFNLIHSLSISDQRIASVAINSSGDWIGFGCSRMGQLLVWEWQSESYVFKQQGHFNNMAPWPTLQMDSISQLEGTTARYRNFRTFTSPRPAQFSSLAVDVSGELVSAGAQDSFEIFLWSMQTGRLLEVLGGHEGPVSSLCFSPVQSVLASASWDKTVRLWDMLDSWQVKETLPLTADAILAGGQSKFVCIYNVKEQMLMKKFEISCNLSFDAMEEFLDRRKMTEFGSLTLVDDGAGDGEGVNISLPGVRKGDMSSRHFKPEIRVSSLRFSPTGRSWAATSTEGLVVYSLDSSMVFDPYDLDLDVTPDSIRKQLRLKEWTSAIVLAFRLNEKSLKQEVIETVPHDQIGVVCGSLPNIYVEKLLGFIASCLEKSGHLQFFMSWAQTLLMLHGQKLKNRSGAILPTLQALQKAIQRHYDSLSKLCKKGSGGRGGEDDMEEDDEDDVAEERSDASVEEAEMLL